MPPAIRAAALTALLLSLPPAVAAQAPAAPGRLIDIGGYSLHLHCIGIGAPTVVLDSGTGGFSLEWTEVQQALSPRHRVCAYDRAGYGWSEFGPLPRTSKRIAAELRRLLANSRTPGPYVLVGHSFGGYTAQYFARAYPRQTAAIVLLDSSHPEQIQRMPKAEAPPRKRSFRRARTYTISRPVLHKNYPRAVADLAWPMIASRKHTRTWRQEMMSLPASGMELARARPMPDIPVVVVTRGRRVWPATERGDEMERVWMELQDELSAVARQPVHLIAENSGHSVHLDQPVYVINALNAVLGGL